MCVLVLFIHQHTGLLFCESLTCVRKIHGEWPQWVELPISPRQKVPKKPLAN